MNCHIVPKVYLKAWKSENKPLYVFEKTETNKTGVPKNIEMKGTSFAAEDAYLLTLSDVVYLHSLVHEFEPFYSCVAGWNITCNNKPITTIEDFVFFYPEIDTWKITTESGDKISGNHLKAEIDRLWAETVEKRIESFFDHNIENRWNTFLDYVNNHIAKRRYMVQAKHLDYLLEFLAVQTCRVFKNMERLGVDKAIQLFDDAIIRPGKMPKALKKTLRSVFTDDFKTGLCLIQLYYYVCHVNRSDPEDRKYENNTVTAIYNQFKEQMQVIMLVSTGKNAFITSDCPSICIKTTKDYDQHFGGIYLPLTPKVCAYLVKHKDSNRKNKYLIVDVNDDNVGYINYMMAEESIRSVVSGKEQIKDMLCRTPDLANWRDGFHSIGLEHQNI